MGTDYPFRDEHGVDHPARWLSDADSRNKAVPRRRWDQR
jgi:hypothetical protein